VRRHAWPLPKFAARAYFWLVGVLVVLALPVGLYVATDPAYRSEPRPDGSVFVVEVEPVLSPLDIYRVEPLPGEVRGILVVGPHSTNQRRWAFTYPAGAKLHPPTEALFLEPQQELALDLDGDGVADTIHQEVLDQDFIEVRSGADGSLLYRQEDPLEYETAMRAFSLGDLDGDGYGELGLVHPRMNRSYDLSWDILLGAKSWVSVVSGAELFALDASK